MIVSVYFFTLLRVRELIITRKYERPPGPEKNSDRKAYFHVLICNNHMNYAGSLPNIVLVFISRAGTKHKPHQVAAAAAYLQPAGRRHRWSSHAGTLLSFDRGPCGVSMELQWNEPRGRKSDSCRARSASTGSAIREVSMTVQVDGRVWVDRLL